MAQDLIAVVDYGMGNLRSVAKALMQVSAGKPVEITDNPEVLARADRVVVPGQGAMPDCIRELKARNLFAAVVEAAQNKPFLGICIGLQMLFEHSEEGDVAGLGVLPGEVRRFPRVMQTALGERLKVPHMGWNQVQQTRPHPLWAGIEAGSYFYFVHSYYVVPTHTDCIVGTTTHGLPFTSACAQDNIFAVQCHPEKSAQAGLRLLANFAAWTP